MIFSLSGRVFDKDHPLETSVDEIFRLDQINEAMTKVKRGKSKGKTIVIMDEPVKKTL